MGPELSDLTAFVSQVVAEMGKSREGRKVCVWQQHRLSRWKAAKLLLARRSSRNRATTLKPTKPGKDS